MSVLQRALWPAGRLQVPAGETIPQKLCTCVPTNLTLVSRAPWQAARWEDDDTSLQRKQQRAAEKARKQQEAAARKAETKCVV